MRKLKVKSIRRSAAGIKEFELVDLDGKDLAPFTAGSHIEIAAPGGLIRPYSLCNDPAENHRYVVAVLRESHGRGVSKSMHDKVAPGHLLDVSEPKNHFQLDEADDHHCVLLAGGIGATPLLAMAYRLRALGKPFEFHYCVRSTDRLAFRSELEAIVAPERLHLHVSNGQPERRIDIAQVLSNAGVAAQVYCCGPPSLISAVNGACANRPGIRFRYEQFKTEIPEDATAFEVELARSGKVVQIRDNESILVALWRAGCSRPFSCEVGICGTCRTPYLGGEPDHKDELLTMQERNSELLICVSRSRSPRLTLDV